MQQQLLAPSYTKQIFNYLTALAPQFNSIINDFAVPYVIQTLTYDYNSGLATGTLSPSDFAVLYAQSQRTDGEFKNYTITDVLIPLNVFSFTWNQDLTATVVFTQPSKGSIGSLLTFSGFLPIDYNIPFTISMQTDAFTYIIAPDYSIYQNLLTPPPITQLGLYTRNYINKGFNVLATLTFNSSNNSFTYPIPPEIVVTQNPPVYTLSGGQMGAGYIQDWHSNIHIGVSDKFYQQKASGKDNALFVITNDFVANMNQEKFNTFDTANRQDSTQGNYTRMIYTFYVDYIINNTGTAFRSNLQAQAQYFWENIFYKLAGMPMFGPQPLFGQTVDNIYNLSPGSYKIMSLEEGGIMNIARYEISMIVQYFSSALLDTDPFGMYALTGLNMTFLPTGHQDNIVFNNS